MIQTRMTAGHPLVLAKRACRSGVFSILLVFLRTEPSGTSVNTSLRENLLCDRLPVVGKTHLAIPWHPHR
jgi:hypothetical protein